MDRLAAERASQSDGRVNQWLDEKIGEDAVYWLSRTTASRCEAG
jgi:hypothetical protein